MREGGDNGNLAAGFPSNKEMCTYLESEFPKICNYIIRNELHMFKNHYVQVEHVSQEICQRDFHVRVGTLFHTIFRNNVLIKFELKSKLSNPIVYFHQRQVAIVI